MPIKLLKLIERLDIVEPQPALSARKPIEPYAGEVVLALGNMLSG